MDKHIDGEPNPLMPSVLVVASAEAWKQFSNVKLWTYIILHSEDQTPKVKEQWAKHMFKWRGTLILRSTNLFSRAYSYISGSLCSVVMGVAHVMTAALSLWFKFISSRLTDVVERSVKKKSW